MQRTTRHFSSHDADENDPDDDYWNVSDVRAGAKTVVWDNDAGDTSEATKALAQLKKKFDFEHDFADEPPEDTVETVDWSGTKVSYSGNHRPDAKSQFEKSGQSTPRTTAVSTPPVSAFSNSSGLSLTPQSGSQKSLGHQKSPSGGSIGAVSSVSSSSYSLDNAIKTSTPKKEYSQADYTRLDDEYKKLKKKFEQLNRGKYSRADVKDTISRMKSDQPFILEYHRSLADKIELLDAMLDFGDGDLITAVLLFLKNTLSFALFQEQLLKKPLAANHYVAYLRDHYRFEDLATTLFALGRKEEAAMVEFQLACKKSSAPAKIAALKRSFQSTFSADANLTNECQLLGEYVDLLERQQPIDASDDKVAQEGRDPKFKQYPKTASVVDQSVLTTLYYCCLYHYELPQNSFASPLAMREHHKLTDKQFTWIAMRALARQKRWHDIQQLLTSKSFFGGSKIKSPIPMDKLLSILANNGASPETLSIYVRLLDDAERKLQFASKYKCHEVVVDCLVASKDRHRLTEYSSKLTGHTKEAYYAQAALQNSANKWKN